MVNASDSFKASEDTKKRIDTEYIISCVDFKWGFKS